MALVFRLNVEGAKAMARSDEHFDQGRLLDAVLYSRRAASLYVPFAAHVKRADARMDSIALGAEAAKLERVALSAWEAIRSAEMQRPAAFGRNRRRVELANRRIAGLVTSMDSGPLVSEEQSSRRILSALERSERDASAGMLGWGLSQPLCFGSFVVGVFLLGREWSGQKPWSNAARGAGWLTFISVVGWTLSLIFA
jgi:hypothetical protein